MTRPVTVAHRLFENTTSIRVHDDGDVLRVLDGDRGVFATTDSVDVDEFEGIAVAVRTLLGRVGHRRSALAPRVADDHPHVERHNR